ncbi:hypothetical protein MTR_6g082050 [Medicago truncatula]|uniref:Uncharacterized protein n=1 Tax=Medicago truncatula TaxID=3880 RepID=G7KM67_MEDTR|nr:hypothetical protein MTR_6g082050 [Medicago truncatula]
MWTLLVCHWLKNVYIYNLLDFPFWAQVYSSYVLPDVLDIRFNKNDVLDNMYDNAAQ